MGWERYSATEVQLRGDSRYIDEGYYKNPIYVYFPASNNIYQVRGIKQPAFIRNITNHQYKAKNLFWGVLNVR